MPSFADAQTNFIDTINDGPDRLDPTLFAGPSDRVLLGLKAHANTDQPLERIVALEDTFPHTRQHLGDAVFNALASDFVETKTWPELAMPTASAWAFPDCLSDPATRELCPNRMGMA